MRTRVALIALAAALTLTACGGSTSSSGTDASTEATATASAQAADFGTPLDLGNGVSLTISAPATFKPGAFASNYLPTQVPELFTIDVKNGGSSPLDMSTVVFAANSNGNFCTDVLDGDNAINGAPTDPVAAGGSVSFKYAIACDAKVGDPVELTVTVGDTNAALNGTLA